MTTEQGLAGPLACPKLSVNRSFLRVTKQVNLTLNNATDDICFYADTAIPALFVIKKIKIRNKTSHCCKRNRCRLNWVELGGPGIHPDLPLEAVTSSERLGGCGPQLAHLQNGDDGTSPRKLPGGSVR